ncbi:hypothetical protein OROHE_010021 [Orobanche hederae]
MVKVAWCLLIAFSMVDQVAKSLARPVRVWVLDATPGKARAGGDRDDHSTELISFLSSFPNKRELFHSFLLGQLKLTPRVVVGHSFGGRVALSMVDQVAEPLARPARVWVLDATPGKVRADGDGNDRPAELISFLGSFPNKDQRLSSQVHEIVGRINGRFGGLAAVPIHHLLSSQVHEIVGRINGRFGSLTAVPIHHLVRLFGLTDVQDISLEFHALCALYAFCPEVLLRMKRSDIASGSTDRSFIANSVLGTGFVLSTDRHGGYKRRKSRQRRTSDRATLADVFAAEVQKFFEISVNSSYEGFIFKTLNIDAPYEPSRQSNNWLKLKRAYLEGLGDSLDLVPIAAYYGHGKRTGVYGTFVLACYDTNKEEFQSISKIGRLPLPRCKGFSDALLDERSAGLGSKVIPKPKSYLRFSERLNPDVWFEPTEIEEPCVSRLEKADFGFYLIFTYFFKNEEPCVSKLEKTDLDNSFDITSTSNLKVTAVDDDDEEQEDRKFNFFDVTSTSNLKVIAVDDDDEEHEFQHFDDFTLASSWERLCRQWLADGLKNPLERCGWFFFISYYI